MIRSEVTVKRDFEARAAALFVQMAGKFDAETKIEVNDKKISCKSLMGVIAIGVSQGQHAVLSAEGADAETAVKELCEFLSGKDV